MRHTRKRSSFFVPLLTRKKEHLQSREYILLWANVGLVCGHIFLSRSLETHARERDRERQRRDSSYQFSIVLFVDFIRQ